MADIIEDKERFNSCERKCVYETRWDAEIVISYMSKRRKYKVAHAYDCKFCGHWHIGHLIKKGLDDGLVCIGVVSTRNCS